MTLRLSGCWLRPSSCWAPGELGGIQGGLSPSWLGRWQDTEVYQCLSMGRVFRDARRPRGPRRVLVARRCWARNDWAWAGARSSPARCCRAMPWREEEGRQLGSS